MMKRFQAIEFEDYKWFPQFLRDYMTDFFHFQMDTFNLYEPVMEPLSELLEATGYSNIIDLCSGGSGPLPSIQKQLKDGYNREVQITLTDFYPNIPAFERASDMTEGAVDFSSTPVNAMDIPETLTGVRTIFSAFHHFRPNDAAAILADAVKKRAPIAIFELSNRSLAAFAQVLLAGPLSFPFITPFLKPLTFNRIFFTYVIPLLPLFTMWDGAGSNLRSYSPKELDELVLKADEKKEFQWKSGLLKGKIPGVTVTYLIGRPK
jgi:hypothetical protein